MIEEEIWNWIITLYKLNEYKEKKEREKQLLKEITITGILPCSL